MLYISLNNGVNKYLHVNSYLQVNIHVLFYNFPIIDFTLI